MTITLNNLPDSLLFLQISTIHEWFGSKNAMSYFAVLLMRKERKIYSGFQLVSSVCMILALLWLTISLPFVYASQQEFAKQEQLSNTGFPISGNEEEANPFGNSEEKAPNSSSSFSEEYLHDHHKSDYFFSIVMQHHKCENAEIYVAFHGELLVPPPNQA
jgi:hypothetical protein